jgi:hypothetical protein
MTFFFFKLDFNGNIVNGGGTLYPLLSDNFEPAIISPSVPT